MASTVGIWANRALYDTDTFTGTVPDALAETEVTDALAGYLTDQVFRAVPVDDGLSRVLPDRIDGLAPAIGGGLRASVEHHLADVLARPATRDRITTAVGLAHHALFEAVDRGSVTSLEVTDGAVTLDLLPLVVNGIAALPGDLVADRVELPELAFGGDHDEHLSQLSAALGVRLPADLGLVEVPIGPQVERADTFLGQVQSALVLFHRALGAILVITVASLVASFAVAVHRRRAASALLLGSLGAYAMARSIIHRAVTTAPLLALDPANRDAVRVVVTTLSEGLLTLLNLGLVVTALAWLIVWLVGIRRFTTGRSSAGTEGTVAPSTRRRVLATVLAFGAVAVVLVAGFTTIPVLLATGCAVAAAILVALAGPETTPAPPG